MASMRERVTKAGETTYSVLYRIGRKQTSMTFSDLKAAERFRSLVDLLGAEKALAEMRGSEVDDRLTVAELAAAFLEWKARPGGVTPRTLTDYRRDVANWIAPWFGHRAAEAVDERDVQRWVDHMAARLSPKSVADRHMLLHAMYGFGKARSRRLVTHNPCEETELPRRKRKPPKGTTTAEFRALIAAGHEHNPDAADLVLFLGETGWRFSEATALDVRDVTDDGTDVWVDMTRVTRLDGNYRQYFAEDEGKSAAALRYIRLFPDSAAMVRRRVAGRGPGDLVFTNSRGNQWNQNTFLRNTWPGLLKAAGLHERDPRPTPHWLRHMHVAVLSAAGVPMQEIQRRIGHEHYATTVDVYGRRIGDVGADAMSRATAIMRGEREGYAEVVRGEVVAELG